MDSAISGSKYQCRSEQTRRVNPSSPGEYFLIRRGSGRVQNLMEGTLKLEDLTYGARSNTLDAVVVTAESGTSCWEGKPSASGKWYHILEGKLEVVVDPVTYTLAEGDSIYLDSEATHIWRNPRRTTAKFLVVSLHSAASPDRTGMRA